MRMQNTVYSQRYCNAIEQRFFQYNLVWAARRVSATFHIKRGTTDHSLNCGCRAIGICHFYWMPKTIRKDCVAL